MLINGAAAPRVLVPERLPRVQVALKLDQPRQGGFAGRPDELVLQVRDAGEEPNPFQPAAIKIWTVTRPLQGRSDDFLLAFVRKINLLRASWAFFDSVAARVSAEMRKGPRGGGRDRDRIIRHTIRTESEDFAKRVGLRIPEGGALTPDGLVAHRESFVAAIRAYNGGEGRRTVSWTLPFLIRHSAFHVMDHACEMEDKDLSAEAQA